MGGGSLVYANTLYQPDDAFYDDPQWAGITDWRMELPRTSCSRRGCSASANLGANPSLTITAQAERAMAFWPNRGEPDPRPSLGSAYRSVPRVRPRSPALS